MSYVIVVMMDKWSDDSACRVFHDVWLYSMLGAMIMFVVVWCLALWLVCLCYVVRVADDICY